MVKSKKYTDTEFIEAVKHSQSIRQVLIKLGLREAGGNYASCKDKIAKLNLDISHFGGQAWSKGKKKGYKRPIEDYLSNQYSITSHRLRLRLIDEGLLEYKCQSCNGTDWLKQPIPLELDHIDGNRKNNELSNLRLLCPNCHALTPTYRGKNIGRQGGTRTHNL